MRIVLFLVGLALIATTYFVRWGSIFIAGLGCIFMALDKDGFDKDDWRSKYRPG